MIQKNANEKFEVRSADGKKLLGTHDTYALAVRQLAAIEHSKQARRTGGKD